MRRKAEQAIRQAAATLGSDNMYRIDQVRAMAGIVRKVFDKTLLDMARLGAVALKGGETEGLLTGDLIRQGETTYVYFSFLEAVVEPEKMDADLVGISLPGLDTPAWYVSTAFAAFGRGKSGVSKLVEIIHQYNQNIE